MPVVKHRDLTRLQAFIKAHFNDSELRELCFLMGVDYHDLGGEGRAVRAQELVCFCERRGLTATLAQHCCRLRPHACAEIDSFVSDPTGSLPPIAPSKGSCVIRLTLFVVGIVVLGVTAMLFNLYPNSNLYPSPSHTVQVTTTPRPTAIEAFVGTWQVSHQDEHGSSLENWEITTSNGTLAIEAFKEMIPGSPLPGDYHEQLALSQVRYEDGILHVTIKRSPSVTTEYALSVKETDRIEGTYSTVDTTLRDTGAIQGENGILRYFGEIFITRQGA